MKNGDDGYCHYNSLGTLGTPGGGKTCSLDAAENFAKADLIQCYPKFEAAADAVKKSLIEAFLVPAAYPKLGSFINDKELTVREVFIHTIPPLIFASLHKTFPENIETLFYHPATTPLLKELQLDMSNLITVDSNAMACELSRKDKGSSGVITNQLCANHYGFVTHQTLRKSINMPFIIFEKIRLDKPRVKNKLKSLTMSVKP